MADRYVLLGLAHPRSPWFPLVARWATSGAVPAEFVKCVSAEELGARLASGRPFSALLVDAGLPALDRDLVDRARRAGCAVVGVDDGRAGRDLAELGVAAGLAAAFTRDELVDVLVRHARPVGRAEAGPGALAGPDPAPPSWRGQLVAVCGPGGTGASTVAVALAQGLALDPRAGGAVLLADLALHAEQAMLHDARDVAPGVQELVDAHRSGRPAPDEVRGLTFAVAERGYALLLGLRRARHWSALRPRAFEAALDSLQRTHHAVVCDVDADLEGEDECGSAEVEERHLMSRATVARADAVLAVGLPTMKGLHALARVLHDLAGAGVPARRILPVLNRAPRSGRQRAALSAAVADLAGPGLAGDGLPGPLYLPERKVDDALRDGVRLPAALTDPLVGAVLAVRERAGTRTRTDGADPIPVRPGSLGHFAEDEA